MLGTAVEWPVSRPLFGVPKHPWRVRVDSQASGLSWSSDLTRFLDTGAQEMSSLILALPMSAIHLRKDQHPEQSRPLHSGDEHLGPA